MQQYGTGGAVSLLEPGNATTQADELGGTVEIREKAVEVALAVTSGAYQTTLLTYFIQRDLFPAVMKVRRSSLEGKTGALTRAVHPRCRYASQDRGAVHPRRAPRQLQQV